MLTEKLWYTAAIFRWQQLNVQWKQEWFAVMHKGVNNVRPTLEGSRCGNDTIATSSSLHVTDTGWWQTTKFKVLLERPGSRGSSLLHKAQQPPPIRCQCYPTISCTSVQGGAANRPVWAREHCRISPPPFLAECRKRRLNQGTLVLLYFRLFTFSDLYW